MRVKTHPFPWAAVGCVLFGGFCHAAAPFLPCPEGQGLTGHLQEAIRTVQNMGLDAWNGEGQGVIFNFPLKCEGTSTACLQGRVQFVVAPHGQEVPPGTPCMGWGRRVHVF